MPRRRNKVTRTLTRTDIYLDILTALRTLKCRGETYHTLTRLKAEMRATVGYPYASESYANKLVRLIYIGYSTKKYKCTTSRTFLFEPKEQEPEYELTVLT